MFKKSTIRYAFKKSRIYPLDAIQCLKQLKTFNPPKEKKAEGTLPVMVAELIAFTAAPAGQKGTKFRSRPELLSYYI
jgi:hypothetical protein